MTLITHTNNAIEDNDSASGNDDDNDTDDDDDNKLPEVGSESELTNTRRIGKKEIRRTQELGKGTRISNYDRF